MRSMIGGGEILLICCYTLQNEKKKETNYGKTKCKGRKKKYKT